jgi:hypothetical protein
MLKTVGVRQYARQFHYLSSRPRLLRIREEGPEDILHVSDQTYHRINGCLRVLTVDALPEMGCDVATLEVSLVAPPQIARLLNRVGRQCGP